MRVIIAMTMFILRSHHLHKWDKIVIIRTILFLFLLCTVSVFMVLDIATIKVHLIRCLRNVKNLQNQNKTSP